MKVTMKAQIAGTRDGEDWPPVGAAIDLPDDEAADLITNGYAVEGGEIDAPADDAPAAVEETADAPKGGVETATKKRG